MYQHKSIAEAKLKGTIRISGDREKVLLKESRELIQHSRSLLTYKKGILKYIALFKEMANERMLYEYCSPKRSSWHHKSEFITFMPDFGSSEYYKEAGRLIGMMLNTFNTRRILKGKRDGHTQLFLKIYIQEHFCVRYMQRIGAETIGDIGKSFYPIIEWLLVNNVPFKHIPESYYFVLPEFISVGSKSPNGFGLLIKTVLTYEGMSEHQTLFFSEALAQLRDNDALYGLLVNNDGTIVRSIPKVGKQVLATIDIATSNWLTPAKDILEGEMDATA